MNFQTSSSGLFLVLLSLAGSAVAAPYVREARFHRVFDGTNFYGEGNRLPVNLSVISMNGKVETSGPIVISADRFLYLSTPEVYLNADFSVKLGGEVKIE